MGRSAIRDQLEILGIAEGFLQSNVLFALLELRVFELIGPEERSVDDLATDVGADRETLARLLRAGVALHVLETADGDRFSLAPAARRILLPGPDYLGDWIRNLAYFRDATSQLHEAVRTSTAPATFVHDGAGVTHAGEFTMAMHNYAALRGRELARFLDTSGCRTLLDVGAGPGTYAFQLGEQNPELELFLLDSPPVLAVAKQVADLYRLSQPVHYLEVDVNEEEIPGSYDLVLVSNTLHMLGEANSRAFLRAVHDHVNPGGSLVVQAQFLRESRTGDRWPVFLDLIQLCITREGRNHTVGETTAWLEDAGFVDVEFCPLSLLNTNSYLRAWKR